MSTLALQCAQEYAHLGYGTFGACLAKGLAELGVEVWTPAPGQYATVVASHYKTVVWASVPGHANGSWEGQQSILFSMWESTRLPEPMRSRLHNFDLVIVPNDSNVELFGRYHPNVVKIPLGYDAEVWSWQRPALPEDTFRFLFCGAGAGEKSRKGSDIAQAAFLRAFPAWQTMTPSPRLVVKCLRFPPDPAPYMEHHVGAWPLADLVSLYRTCHAMILPSRGEGWGYHPQQAVASGLPAIVSGIPGHTEYCGLPGFATVPVTLTKAGSFLQGDAGQWWEPDVDATVDAMRDVYDRWADWTEAAWAGGEILRGRFTHTHMAQALVDTIGADQLVTLPDPGEWLPFTERLYPLEVTRFLSKHDCTVGETSYEFHTGERYWVQSHVRQVLAESGYLANPDEDHPGLLPEQVPA